MKANQFFMPALTLAASLGACSHSKTRLDSNASIPAKPNIIYILTDDLGYGDLGCYGQEKIKTPNIDKLAAQGMLFTRHYSGSTVCAPSRSSLLTGLHTGHTYIRGNTEIQPEGQEPIPAEALTIAEVLKTQGYVTGAFGKWGLGMADTEGSPNKQGFDQYFGPLCQRNAHRYYPTYLWENEHKFMLGGNDWTDKVTYAPDVIQARVLDFIKANKDTSFFLYVPCALPHAELLVPDDSLFQKYKGLFEETPFGLNAQNVHQGNDYGSPDFSIQGYAPQPTPKAAFAAMVSRLDLYVGEIMELVNELGLTENTIIVFTSDNGPHREAGADPDFFGSNGGLRGYKRDMYEGGIRVPMIASWPGKIQAGSSTDHISAFWDVLPTFAEIAGIEIPEKTDGISFLPEILGSDTQKDHDYLYWEFYEMNGRLAVLKDDWKLIRYDVKSADKITMELYNLKEDPKEQNNLAEKFPDRVNEMLKLMTEAHTPTEKYSIQANP